MIDLSCEYSYAELLEEMKNLQMAYPMDLAFKSIGVSEEGREIPMLILGNGERSTIITGGVHGRENKNPAVLIRMADDYVSRLNNHPKLQQEKLFLIPLLNPDGYEIARLRDVSWKNNGCDVDINRNFPSVTWKQKKQGDFPASEAETRAFMDLCKAVNPQGYIDYHSRGNSIFYYRAAMDNLYNQKQKQIAIALSKSTGYTLEEPSNEINKNDSGGNTVHFFSEIFKKPAITIETVREEEPFPLRIGLQWEIYEAVKETFFVFLKAL